ncbi:MAG: glucose 1-dehydrogenase [Pseudomonadales bacterium]|nr:glucose 1-dehydrogenase [Pseudomonadales bacterium]MCP5185245.1 glucose 1-dehydrogenase [Pseudomonadales bacterium]
MGRVDGKVAIVTGGASNPGLGRATAMALGREGARVVVTDVDLAGAENTAAAIRDAGGQALALHQDVTSESRWQEVIAETVKAYGRLDVLVNNAGIAVLKPIANLSLADWNRQIDVNLTSVFLGCKYAMAQMKTSGGGAIVNLSSVAGLVGLATCSAYSAAKGGVRLMTKVVAVEGGADNIRCNSVHPGVIWTNMQAAAVGSSNPGDANVAAARIPLGRVGQPEDIANCILYLASDEANYVTGAEFTVDAGMTAI